MREGNSASPAQQRPEEPRAAARLARRRARRLASRNGSPRSLRATVRRRRRRRARLPVGGGRVHVSERGAAVETAAAPHATASRHHSCSRSKPLAPRPPPWMTPYRPARHPPRHRLTAGSTAPAAPGPAARRELFHQLGGRLCRRCRRVDRLRGGGGGGGGWWAVASSRAGYRGAARKRRYLCSGGEGEFRLGLEGARAKRRYQKAESASRASGTCSSVSEAFCSKPALLSLTTEAWYMNGPPRSPRS